MAMLGPADRDEDRRAGLRAFYMILGLVAFLGICLVLVFLYYYGYPI